MSFEAARARQELRRSNAAVPHRNRYREAKSGSGLHDVAITEGVSDYFDSEPHQDMRN